MLPMKELKLRVLEAMTIAGLNQSQLAAKAGVSKSAISQVLAGTTLELKGPTAAGIEQATGYSATWLATGKGEKLAAHYGARSQDELAAKTTARFTSRPQSLQTEYAGAPRYITRAPVVFAARMDSDGLYEEAPATGFVPAYSSDPTIYAIQIKGDALSPAIKSGYFVVLEPVAEPQPGERVLLGMRDGRRMLKEYRFNRAGAVVVASILGGAEESIETDAIEWVHAVASVVEPSRWQAA